MKRARGRAYPCACGEEKLRAPKGGLGRIDGWSYLFGECGGGVKLRFEGIKVAQVKEVSKEEAERIKALPSIQGDFEALQSRRPEDLDKAEAIWSAGYEDFKQGASHWYRWGEYLEKIKEILGHGGFGVFLKHKGFDPYNANRFVRAWQTVRALPRYSSTLINLEPTKVLALWRLPDRKRLEFLEDGVPVNGELKPITKATFREVNKAVQEIKGKDPRGRKRTRPPSFPFTTQQALFDTLDKILANLRRLKREDLEGLTDTQRERAQDQWLKIFELVQEVHEALRMDERLPVHIKGRK